MVKVYGKLNLSKIIPALPLWFKETITQTVQTLITTRSFYTGPSEFKLKHSMLARLLK